jgi:branched-chain amino acid transport system permease protein
VSLAEAPSAASAVEAMVKRHRLKPWELVPWLVGLAAYFAFPDYLSLGSQIFVAILFALSLDLILGYGGIVTLGQAAFFGAGAYTAGLLSVHGWAEPLSGLLAGGAVAALLGLLSGAIILRTRGLTLLMLTLVIAFMLEEAANKAQSITGGADGLQGMQTTWPVLGLFPFDFYFRTAYLYGLAVLFLAWLVVRRVVHSPFGRSLTGIRESEARMHAIGSPVFGRRLAAYTLSAALAGVAGALLTETTGFVGLAVLGFERSGNGLIMLIIGGVGRLYGAFIGAPLFAIAQDRFSEASPVYWNFWIGLLLVAVALFARDGVLGLAEQFWRRARRRR